MRKCNELKLLVYNFIDFPNFSPQISPAQYVSENYYEVDGVLTTKLEQVDVSTKDKALPKCSDYTSIVGKGGVHYLKHGAFCMETQKFPDAVNHVTLRKGNLPSIRSIIFSPSGKFPFNNLEPWYNLQAFSRLQVRSQCLIQFYIK